MHVANDAVIAFPGVFDHPGEHAFVTSFYGSACSTLGSPYINNCRFDAAGDILQHLSRGALTPPADVAKFHGQVRAYLGEVVMCNK
jgi:hypothetical protein